MSRELTSAMQTEVSSASQRPVLLARFELDSGTIRFHSRLGDIVFNGEVYTGAGSLGSVGVINEDSDMARPNVAFTLTGLDPALISAALGEYYQGRKAFLYLGFMNDSNTLIADPVLIFSGKIDNAPMAIEGSTASITLSVENEFADWERPKVRRYNDADQKSRFPGDNFFKFAELASKEIFWGRSG